MAAGDVIVFEDWLKGQFNAGTTMSDFDTPDTYYCAIIDNTTAITAALADPHWNGTGTTNLQANELTGGDFSANGKECTSATLTWVTGELQIDFGNPSWANNASNPSGCYWAIVYNNTIASKKCVLAVDLGGPVDYGSDTLDINFAAPVAKVVIS